MKLKFDINFIIDIENYQIFKELNYINKLLLFIFSKSLNSTKQKNE